MATSYDDDQNEDSDAILNGYLTYTYENGDIYEGYFSNGQRQGQGTYTSSQGDVYKGQFSEDDYHGQGMYRFSNGNIYVGRFIRGSIEGIGTYSFADGGSYTGKLLNGMRHGRGVMRLPSGIILEGTWSNDNYFTNSSADGAADISRLMSGQPARQVPGTAQKEMDKKSQRLKFLTDTTHIFNDSTNTTLINFKLSECSSTSVLDSNYAPNIRTTTTVPDETVILSAQPALFDPTITKSLQAVAMMATICHESTRTHYGREIDSHAVMNNNAPTSSNQTSTHTTHTTTNGSADEYASLFTSISIDTNALVIDKFANNAQLVNSACHDANLCPIQIKSPPCQFTEVSTACCTLPRSSAGIIVAGQSQTSKLSKVVNLLRLISVLSRTCGRLAFHSLLHRFSSWKLLLDCSRSSSSSMDAVAVTSKVVNTRDHGGSVSNYGDHTDRSNDSDSDSDTDSDVAEISAVLSRLTRTLESVAARIMNSRLNEAWIVLVHHSAHNSAVVQTSAITYATKMAFVRNEVALWALFTNYCPDKCAIPRASSSSSSDSFDHGHRHTALSDDSDQSSRLDLHNDMSSRQSQLNFFRNKSSYLKTESRYLSKSKRQIKLLHFTDLYQFCRDYNITPLLCTKAELLSVYESIVGLRQFVPKPLTQTAAFGLSRSSSGRGLSLSSLPGYGPRGGSGSGSGYTTPGDGDGSATGRSIAGSRSTSTGTSPSHTRTMRRNSHGSYRTPNSTLPVPIPTSISITVPSSLTQHGSAGGRKSRSNTPTISRKKGCKGTDTCNASTMGAMEIPVDEYYNMLCYDDFLQILWRLGMQFMGTAVSKDVEGRAISANSRMLLLLDHIDSCDGHKRLRRSGSTAYIFRDHTNIVPSLNLSDFSLNSRLRFHLRR